jgi:hypothetical protein
MLLPDDPDEPGKNFIWKYSFNTVINEETKEPNKKSGKIITGPGGSFSTFSFNL